MTKSDRELGMDRSITRRDFLNGVSVAVGGAMIAPAPADAAEIVQQSAAGARGGRQLPARADRDARQPQRVDGRRARDARRQDVRRRRRHSTSRTI